MRGGVTEAASPGTKNFSLPPEVRLVLFGSGAFPSDSKP